MQDTILFSYPEASHLSGQGDWLGSTLFDLLKAPTETFMRGQDRLTGSSNLTPGSCEKKFHVHAAILEMQYSA